MIVDNITFYQLFKERDVTNVGDSSSDLEEQKLALLELKQGSSTLDSH